MRYTHKRRRADDDDGEESEEVILKVHNDTIYYRGDIQEPQATDFCIELRKLSERMHDTTGTITVHAN